MTPFRNREGNVVLAAYAHTAFPSSVSIVSRPDSVPGMKRCAVAPRRNPWAKTRETSDFSAPSGTEACWELADPTMTDIPDDFLKGNTDLTGTLKVGAAVRTIGASAFANTKLAGLDLSEATSLVSIGDSAFFNTDLEGTLVLPATVTTISNSAFSNTQLNSLDISNAAALDSDSIWHQFSGTLRL